MKRVVGFVEEAEVLRWGGTLNELDGSSNVGGVHGEVNLGVVESCGYGAGGAVYVVGELCVKGVH